VLLPYTGQDGAAGGNYERGVLMAAAQINAAGGLDGKPLSIVFADTHSSLQRGQDSADTLLSQGVVAIIGPEDDDLARALQPKLDAVGVPLITPSSSSGPASSSASSASSTLWFRLAPSGQALGTALARQMQADGAKRIDIITTGVPPITTGVPAVVVTPGIGAAYQGTVVEGITNRLTNFGQKVIGQYYIPAGDSQFPDQIMGLIADKPDAVVLAADPTTASTFVNEFSASEGGAHGIRWYLSPTLQQEGFVLNSFPEIVDGMVGVAPAVSSDEAQTQAFADSFAQSWSGAAPTTGAYFYYDALAMFALAFEGAATSANSATPPSQTVRKYMLEASGQSGLVVAWNQLQQGLAKASSGAPVDYSGLTGIIALDGTGARSTVYPSFWTIQNQEIVPLKTN
jgi:branched-chain amino acid transport system substrate-binding protein